MTNWTLVTGGAKNLGADLSLALAKNGHHVLVHYKSSKREAEDLVEHCRGFGVSAECVFGDFSTQERLESFIEDLTKRYPSIKYLVHNVGNYLAKSLLQTSMEEWSSLIQTNVSTPLALIKAFVPSVKELQGGILSIGSVGIHLNANIYNPAYMLTKTCLLYLTKSLAKELGADLIPVNMVSPGILNYSIDKAGNIPMKRFAESEDVIRAVLFLLDNDNRYITGQNIEVAGGMML